MFGGKPKMSEVILDLAAPLLDSAGSDPNAVEAIIQLTIIAWNNAMSPVAHQAEIEKKIIDTLVPAGGDAEEAATIAQTLKVVEDRRKKRYPTLRKYVVHYDLRVSEDQIELHVASEAMLDNR